MSGRAPLERGDRADLADDFLAEQLKALEHLCAEHPTAPETRSARRLIRRVRYYLRRNLLDNAPRSRRYLLADVRAASRRLERLSARTVGGRDPPP